MPTIYIDLDDHSRHFLNNLLTTGRYNSENDVIQAGLSLLEEEEKLHALRQALIEGEKSGESNRSFDEIVTDVKARLSRGE